MGLCPVCNSSFADEVTTCPVCNADIDSDSDNQGKWLVLGVFKDPVSAGLAHETLLNADIPAVLFSKAGFFGAAGLAMNPFYNPTHGMYEISVPVDMFEDATEIINAIMSGGWHSLSKDEQNNQANDDN